PLKDPASPPRTSPQGAAPPTPEHLRLKSALWDRTTGLASFHFHIDELRAFLDNRRQVGLLHVTCGELGLVESIYGWQVLDRVMERAVEVVRGLQGRMLSRRALLAVNGVAGEEILVFEPGEDASEEIGPRELNAKA